MPAGRKWTEPEVARLLLFATTERRHCCIDFARATGRSTASVRVKLCRLEKNPETRPPQCAAAATDAAAPRVTTACGPSGTPDKSD